MGWTIFVRRKLVESVDEVLRPRLKIGLYEVGIHVNASRSESIDDRADVSDGISLAKPHKLGVGERLHPDLQEATPLTRTVVGDKITLRQGPLGENKALRRDGVEELVVRCRRQHSILSNAEICNRDLGRGESKGCARKCLEEVHGPLALAGEVVVADVHAEGVSRNVVAV